MTFMRLKLPINLYVAIIYERRANYKYGFFLIKCEKNPRIKILPLFHARNGDATNDRLHKRKQTKIKSPRYRMVPPLMTDFIKESKLKLKVQDKASLLTDYQMLKPIIKNL